MPPTRALLLLALIATRSVAIPQLCNSTLSSANASGIFNLHVDYTTPAPPHSPDGRIPDPSWAITVNEQGGNTQTSIWYSTGGQPYYDDLALQYDVCAYYILDLPVNTLELGQDDPGDCSSAFTEQCRTAILERTAASAFAWTKYSSQPPYNNLTAGVLPTICQYIISDLGQGGYNFPTECMKEFDVQPSKVNPTTNYGFIEQAAFTGYADSDLFMQCPLHVGDKTYYEAHTNHRMPYNHATRYINPILTVWMPLANIARTIKAPYAVAKLTCAHVKDFHQGSQVSPRLPEGTPYNYSKGLSKGAIAGIVVGVVIFVALLIGLVAFLVLRRRRRQRQRQQIENHTVEQKADSDSTETSELSPVDRSELNPEDRKHEADSKHTIVEIGNAQGSAVEMGYAQGKPAEMGA